jgi:hypothetical protein
MKQYISHKIVEAAPIITFNVGLNLVTVKIAEDGAEKEENIEVPPYFFAKCQAEGRFPQEGDFLVKYPAVTETDKDYWSWSPREKFLSGI